jgi:hypothetical protein
MEVGFVQKTLLAVLTFAHLNFYATAILLLPAVEIVRFLTPPAPFVATCHFPTVLTISCGAFVCQPFAAGFASIDYGEPHRPSGQQAVHYGRRCLG